MEQAISDLSLGCNPRDSVSALYLMSAPKDEMNMDLVKVLGESLSNVAPDAIIRYGDYPRARGKLKITVILSQLKRADKVKKYYDRFPSVTKRKERVEKDVEAAIREFKDASITIPSLV